MDGSRIRKEKVPDSKISGYVWTGPKRYSIKLKDEEADIEVTGSRRKRMPWELTL